MFLLARSVSCLSILYILYTFFLSFDAKIDIALNCLHKEKLNYFPREMGRKKKFSLGHTLSENLSTFSDLVFMEFFKKMKVSLKILKIFSDILLKTSDWNFQTHSCPVWVSQVIRVNESVLPNLVESIPRSFM